MDTLKQSAVDGLIGGTIQGVKGTTQDVRQAKAQLELDLKTTSEKIANIQAQIEHPDASDKMKQVLAKKLQPKIENEITQLASKQYLGQNKVLKQALEELKNGNTLKNVSVTNNFGNLLGLPEYAGQGIDETANNFSFLQNSEKNLSPESSILRKNQSTNNLIPLNNLNGKNDNLTSSSVIVSNFAQNQPNIGQNVQNNVQNVSNLKNNQQMNISDAENTNATLPSHIQTFVENRNQVSPGLNVQMDNTLNTDGVIIKNQDGTRTIKVNPNSNNVYEFVTMHEMLHDLSGTQEYQELANFVKERAMTHDTFEEAKQTITDKYAKYYQENGLDMSNLNMDVETVNDMTAQALGNQEFLNELAGKKPNVFKRIWNWIKMYYLTVKKQVKHFLKEERIANT